MDRKFSALRFFAVLLSLAVISAGTAFASVAINGPVTQSNTDAAGTVQTDTAFYAVSAGSNCLVILQSSGKFSGGATPSVPSGITYNGLALTMVPSSSSTDGNFASTSIWYLLNPPTGTAYTLVATYPTSVDTSSMIYVGLSGANTGTPVRTPATAHGTGTSLAVTATGGVAGDLYLGHLFMGVEGSTITAAAGQTNLTIAYPRTSFGTSADSIAGGSAGAFSWTPSGSQDGWSASAVAFEASGGASTPVQGGFALSPSN